jgi:DUF1680 family protein
MALSLAMPVERMTSHPRIVENAGRVALQRGPIVYCLEQCDHTAPVRSIVLPDDAELAARFDEELVTRPVIIQGGALAPSKEEPDGPLYRPASGRRYDSVHVKAIPYFMWDNRGPGAMAVWLPRT